ncbi:uncharacterized protein LOC121744687 [Salvia splendens]|uniref:uncharacterized protein LOC121744687 n=1 Tax=Salvia splendens TaxID=180675 RepID=UPI001C264407|nr:uncharacterized protein LOC121744687 [Salvia splendens]
MSETEKVITGDPNSSEADEFARLFSNFMRKSLMQNQPPENPDKPEKPIYKTDSQPLTVGFKLNGENYPVWSILMHNAISGRGMVSHITGVPSPPARTDPTFTQWQEADHCVFTWLVQNIETKLVSRVAQQPTAKHIWDSLAVTYKSGGDSLQIYDLHRRASTLKQGNTTLEEVWNDLNEIWTAIDQKRPNRMKCPDDIQIHNEETEQNRLYQFLTALDDKYEIVKREVLKMEPLPSAEQAYNIAKREDARSEILRPTDGKPPGDGIGAGLFTARRPNHSTAPRRGGSSGNGG